MTLQPLLSHYSIEFLIIDNGLLMAKWILMVFSVGLVACGNDSAMIKIADFDLAERYGQCLDRKPTAPGKAQACENLRRECERRRAELGSYICRSR